MCCVAPGRTSGWSTVTRSAGPDERTVCDCARNPTGRGVGELGGDVAVGVAVATPPVLTTTTSAGVFVGAAVRVGVDVSAGKVPLPLCVGVVVGVVGGIGVLVADGMGVLVADGMGVLVAAGGGALSVRSPCTPTAVQLAKG
jgi:hypothetical protein